MNEPKPGWKSTEHWGSVGSAAAFLTFASGSSDRMVVITSLVCAAAVTAVYTVSRTLGKGAAK